MSIFCTDSELQSIKDMRFDDSYSGLWWGIINRVEAYCREPGLSNAQTTTEWWHHVAEYLSEAAFVAKVQPSDRLINWLRTVTMEIVERSDDDWCGPSFRNHTTNPLQGHLETTHLCIGVSMVYDLCPGIFSAEQLETIKAKLQTGMQMCREWMVCNHNLANWHSILLAGVAVPAAVLQDKAMLEYSVHEYRLGLDSFQPDGSYGESLQYSNYCCYGLMHIYESLSRSGIIGDELPGYANVVNWLVQSFFYNKPLADWGQYPRPRSANFNDSASITGGDPDLLLQISVRMKEQDKTLAGLARWMFDLLYNDHPSQGPFDRNSFGFVNRYGFLSMLFYPAAAQAVTPTECAMDTTAYFTNGNGLSRDSWSDTNTILAFSGGTNMLHTSGHLHCDLNSLILVHQNERLLADPGHTCYRSSIRGSDVATDSHNTCTFVVADNNRTLNQNIKGRRGIDANRNASGLVDRLSKHLLCEEIDDVAVMAADAAAAYDDPIDKFERYCIRCGSHAVFIVDRIRASAKVVPHWHWVLNNRDGSLEHKVPKPDRIVARKGKAGMKLFYLGKGWTSCPHHGSIHDAYHPLPNQLGEGKSDTAVIYHVTDGDPQTEIDCIHAIALDGYGKVAKWHLKSEDYRDCSLDDGQDTCWNVKLTGEEILIQETNSGRSYRVDLGSSNFEKI